MITGFVFLLISATAFLAWAWHKFPMTKKHLEGVRSYTAVDPSAKQHAGK